MMTYNVAPSYPALAPHKPYVAAPAPQHHKALSYVSGYQGGGGAHQLPAMPDFDKLFKNFSSIFNTPFFQGGGGNYGGHYGGYPQHPVGGGGNYGQPQTSSYTSSASYSNNSYAAFFGEQNKYKSHTSYTSAPVAYHPPAPPKYEAPKYEAPKYEAPKYEAPKYEAPKYEAPKKEEYKAPEQPKYEAPVAYHPPAKKEEYKAPVAYEAPKPAPAPAPSYGTVATGKDAYDFSQYL
jgi:hypothetical protein